MVVSRKKLLLLIPSLGGGGAERVFSILLRHLDRTLFEPHLALLRGENVYGRDIPDDVVVHEIQVSRTRYALPGVIRVIRTIRPEIVLATQVRMNMIAILAKPLLPRGTRVFLRESISPSTSTTNKFASFLWRILYRELYRRADRIVCLSDNMVNEITAEFKMPHDKLVRIYNPVDSRRVRELGEAGANPYSGPGPRLVAAGRLCRQKGFDLLLSAMPMVRQALPGAQLAILGQGILQNELEAQAHRLGLDGAVRFWGFQRNPWPFIKHADVFVLPSRFEGLPNILLEAMALETPIIATDCPGGVAEIQSYVRGMTVIPPEDPVALARAVISTCGTSRHNENGSGDIAAFALQKIVGEYSDLLLS